MGEIYAYPDGVVEAGTWIEPRDGNPISLILVSSRRAAYSFQIQEEDRNAQFPRCQTDSNSRESPNIISSANKRDVYKHRTNITEYNQAIRSFLRNESNAVEIVAEILKKW
jgi:hypothetical protein